jgi:ABC-2 type transport system permease protein
VSVSTPLRAVLRSEWTKFRTLRGAWVCLGVYAAAVVVGAWTSLSGSPAQEPRGAVATALVGFAAGQLALVVLGALVVTHEYRTGTVLASLTAVPGRTRWLLGKTLLAVSWAALLTAVLVVGCVVAIPVFTAGAPDVPLTEPVALRPMVLQVLAAALLVVLGAGLGALLRRTAAAAVAGLLLVVVLPVVTAVVGEELVSATAPYWPALRVGVDDLLTVASRGDLGLPSGGDVLLAGASDWRLGLVVHAAWALALWVLGVVVTERRDA